MVVQESRSQHTRRLFHSSGRFFLAFIIALGVFAANCSPAQAADPDTGTISGTVTDSEGHPLENIPVYANTFDTDTHAADTSTNAAGEYQLAVPVGDYRVRACPACTDPALPYANQYAGGTPFFSQAQRITIDAVAEIETQDFTLQPGGIISGTVAVIDGDRIEGITIAVVNEFGEWYDAANTDSDGNYRIAGLPVEDVYVYACADCQGPATYVNSYYAGSTCVVDLTQAWSVTVVAGLDPRVINLNLAYGNTIQGRVTDNEPSANPIGGVWVAAIPWDSDIWFKSIETAPDGTYSLTGLPDGDYRVQACPECSNIAFLTAYYHGTPNYDEAAPVTLLDGQTVSALDFSLEPAGVIGGRVTDPTGLTPLANIPLYAENTVTGQGFSAQTNDNGEYTLFVQPGFYRLQTMTSWNADLAGDYVDEIYDSAANLEDARVVSAQSGSPSTGHDMTLEPAGAITGMVEDGSGGPLEYASVMAVAIDGSSRSFASQNTGSDGVFSLAGLPAGNYVLRATHPGSQARFANDQTAWDPTNLVSVAAGATTSGIQFSLPAEPGEDPNVDTLRQAMRLMGEYDPGRSSFVEQVNLIDQIFAGLTRINPVDGTTIENLVDSWSTDDYIHWTFTLRAGLEWSDGSPLTAWDLRYGILRSLRLDSTNEFTNNLRFITGAQAYNEGTLSADGVGISVSDATHISFVLTQSIAFFPTILTTTPARPLPRLLVQAYPWDWLAPDKVITSGPYRLVEFDADHALLKKNENFIDHGSVEIQQVSIHSVSLSEAWLMYLNGQLDTATIPVANIPIAQTDPLLSQQFSQVKQQCTNFIGFNTDTLGADQPADPAKLRQALIEAIDRDAYNASLANGAITAWTFIAPGVLGHSDESANIHIPYDSAQALVDIQAAYSGSYHGLPDIPLYYQTDGANPEILKAGMEYLANTWNQTLNAHFTVVGITINEYEEKIRANELFAWRRGWCSDYDDGYNFLTSFIAMADMYGNWDWNSFQSLLDAAAAVPNQADRIAQYQDIEQLAIQTNALVLPLSSTVTPMLTKGFIRSYGVGGVDYIADWDFNRSDSTTLGSVPPTSAAIQSEAGVAFTPAGERGTVSYQFPTGAFPGGTLVTHTGHLTGQLANLPDGTLNTSLYFSLQAEHSSQPVNPAADFTLTVQYSQVEIDTIDLAEISLAFYYWDESLHRWVKDANSVVDPLNNRITTHTRHLGDWAVFGSPGEFVFLPFLKR